MTSSKERWNERHGTAIAAGGGDRPPIDWLVEHRALLDEQPRGPALDVACGRGRNAIYLAGMGFDVEAIDVSDVAVDHLARVAAERGLPVRARVWDAEAEGVPPGPYQVIVDAFFLERRILGDLAEALAPGGLLLLDTFLAGGPGDTHYRLLPGELSRVFGGLEVLDLREGSPAPGERARARMVARRPR